MSTIDPRIDKLPKWAQEHIEAILRERGAAVRALQEFEDNQTPSSMFVTEYVSDGETRGATSRKHYVQGHRLEINHAGVSASIILYPKNCQLGEEHISLSFDRGTLSEEAFMRPTSWNQIVLISRPRS